MTTSERRLVVQLRITQVATVVAATIACVALMRRSQLPSSLELGTTHVSSGEIAVGPQRLDDQGLTLLPGGKTPISAVQLRAHPKGGLLSLRSGDVALHATADHLNHRVTIMATGLVRTELRIDTQNGAITVARNVDLDGNPASEVVTPLLGPHGQ